MNSSDFLRETLNTAKAQGIVPEDISHPIGNEINVLVLLMISDRVVHPNAYTIDNSTENPVDLYEQIKNRNKNLVEAFPEIFAPGSFKFIYCQRWVKLFNKNIGLIEKEELLHIPGMLYENGPIKFCQSSSRHSLRKTQGSYYTPSGVVRYMVQNSMEQILGPNWDKHKCAQLRVLDPACGGASFLIEVWDCLARQGVEPDKALEHIFGTDIDPNAVNLAVYLLTLAYMTRSKGAEPLHVKSRWRKQFRIGNALMRPEKDFPGGIDWLTSFPGIFKGKGRRKSDGFDLVIGNPPYVSNKLIPSEEKRYYRENFSSARKQYDLAVPFLEQGLNLLKENGVLSYLTSNKFLAADYGRIIRKKLIEDFTVITLMDVSTLGTFRNTAAYPVILTVSNAKPDSGHAMKTVQFEDWAGLSEAQAFNLLQGEIKGSNGFLMTTKLTDLTYPVIKKIELIKGRVSEKAIKCGLAQTGFNQWIIPNESVFDTSKHNYAGFIQAGDIRAYGVLHKNLIDLDRLKSDKRQQMKGLKLVIPGMAKTLMAGVDCSDSLLGRVYYIRQCDTEYDLSYLVVILNSMVLNFYYSIMYWPVHLQGEYLRFNGSYLAAIPIFSTCDFSNPFDSNSLLKLSVLGNKLQNSRLRGGVHNNLRCQAEAAVFNLYRLSPRDATIIMDFLKTHQLDKELIINLMKEGL